MLKPEDRKCLNLFIRYILVSIIVFVALTIVHSWLTYNQLHIVNFLVPLAAAMAVGFLMARNRILRNQLTLQANTDKLTGAYNRQYFDNRLREEIDKAQRYKHKFSILYLDLDLFKSVNDNFGHAIGDEVLIDFTAIVHSVHRDSDIFARFGGEEFILLAHMSDTKSAMNVYQRIKEATRLHQFKKVESITFSAGIAEFDIEHDTTKSLLDRADKALYAAKEGGRDQAVVADKITTSIKEPS